MAKELTDEQKMKIENLAGFELLTLIAENEKCAYLAREDSEAVALIYLRGCQSGCKATMMVLKDKLDV